MRIPPPPGSPRLPSSFIPLTPGASLVCLDPRVRGLAYARFPFRFREPGQLLVVTDTPPTSGRTLLCRYSIPFLFKVAWFRGLLASLDALFFDF